jgi:hypothetical protein
MSREARIHYARLVAAYLLSRVLLYAIGLRFVSGYDWQHFHSLALLKTRLLESLFYTHTFTPVINLVAGVTLKLSETHAVFLQQCLFVACGAAFVCSLHYLLEGFGVPRRWAVFTSLFFSLTPAYLLFENLLHYEFLSAALLTVTCALFLRALEQPSFWRWFSCFLCGALLVYTRTTFHVAWLLCAVLFAVAFRPREYKRIASAACVPLLLAVALYAKNLVLFGFFGVSTFLPFNLAHVTIEQLSESERAEWVVQHKIHPASLVGMYAGPQAYAPWVALEQKRGVPVLDELERAPGLPNYNHWSFTQIYPLRLAADRYYIAQRPWAYLKTFKKSLLRLLAPTTQWNHSKNADPHGVNRRVLDRWENIYNAVVHTVPPRTGLYAFVIALMLYMTVSASVACLRRTVRVRAWQQASLFMSFSCFWVALLSCLVTNTELARYRLIIEALLWVLCAGAMVQIRARLRRPSEIEITRATQTSRAA